MGHCPSRSARGVTRHRAAGQLVTVRNSVSMPYYQGYTNVGATGTIDGLQVRVVDRIRPMPASFPSKTSLASVRRWSPSGTGWWVRTDPTRPCRGRYRWRTTRFEMCAAVYALPGPVPGTRTVGDTGAVANGRGNFSRTGYLGVRSAARCGDVVDRRATSSGSSGTGSGTMVPAGGVTSVPEVGQQ